VWISVKYEVQSLEVQSLEVQSLEVKSLEEQSSHSAAHTVSIVYQIELVHKLKT